MSLRLSGTYSVIASESVDAELKTATGMHEPAMSRTLNNLYLPAHSRNMDDVHLECRVYGAPPTQLYDGNLYVDVWSLHEICGTTGEKDYT